jgi:uncharacterized protein YcfJ
MFRKLWISALGVGLAATSAGAVADHDRYDNRDDRSGAYDYASVVQVEPLRRQVRVSEPVRECWEESVPVADGPFSKNHIGGTLLGGLVGGVLGNQVGDGRGRRVARAAGAIIGGAVGYNVSRDRKGYAGERVYERCETRYRDSYEERIDGYDVTYEYAGRRYLTQLPYDPGDRIRIRVDVTPAGG